MYNGIEGSTSALNTVICRRKFIMSIQDDLFSNQKPTLLQDIMASKDWIAKALNSSNYAADFSKKLIAFLTNKIRPTVY